MGDFAKHLQSSYREGPHYGALQNPCKAPMERGFAIVFGKAPTEGGFAI